MYEQWDKIGFVLLGPEEAFEVSYQGREARKLQDLNQEAPVWVEVEFQFVISSFSHMQFCYLLLIIHKLC